MNIADPLLPPSCGLDRASVLSAVDVLFSTDVVTARAATAAFKALLTESTDWATQTSSLSGGGLVANYRRGTLAELLDEPCELILARRRDGAYLLLQHQAPHWRIVDANGEASMMVSPSVKPRPSQTASGVDLSDITSDQLVEAVLLRLPHAEDVTVAALSQLWPMLRAAWMEVGLASLFINGGMLLLPLFSMLVYDKVVNNGIFETLWALVLGMGIYLLMDVGMRIVRSWSVERVAADLGQRSDERLWHRLQEQTDFASGSFASFISDYRNLAASRDFVSANYLMGVADLPFLVLFLIVTGIIAWPLLLLVLVLAGSYALVGVYLQQRINQLGKESERFGTQKLALMSETLNALDVVRTTPAAHLLLRRWRALAAETAELEARRRLTSSYGGTLAVGMSTLTSVSILTLGAYLIDGRALTVGGLIAANMLATRSMALVASLFALVSKWEDYRRASTRLEASLEIAQEPARLEKPQTFGQIDVLGLKREYAGRPTALNGVSCRINPGERIALVGRPGSGKTTLLRCLAGICKPDSGQILIDGVALSDIARSDRVRWLAYKAQEPILFAGTLDENLRVAGCPADDPRFVRAIWASGLDEELKSGRLTLGMQLVERGANLSGGQRQKVALARALAQPSRILLLDEPTLGLDPEGERLLAERLPQIVGDGVLIISTHSAVLLGAMQRIIALDAGCVVADGPREQLLRTG